MAQKKTLLCVVYRERQLGVVQRKRLLKVLLKER